MKSKMKNNILQIMCIALATCILSCNDSIEERNMAFPQLNPTNADATAGTWKPILLTAPDEFSLDAPIAATSAAFTREINEIKSYQANISNDQRRIIDYWSAGGVLRWNEIMRELVAKYNRPPYQNADGSYPTPSPANPFASTPFPFSNPPYAARAYAYVSAAQYDALIAAWHYKKLYNRAAPFTIDANFQVMVPKSSLPSYPSEDGVLAGVTIEMLKLLFPTEIAFVQQKAEEQKLYRIISGANVRSDVDAGIILGRKIASKFIARAAADGLGQAIGTPAQWKLFETMCIERGELPWKSLDVPARPPMLPFFGNVKSFLMSPAAILTNRPPPPPSTNSQAFKNELQEVKENSRNVTRENQRIVTFWADGVGTFTPPGHWNMIATEAFVPQNFSEVRWARNLAMLNISMMDAAITCWDSKYFYFNPRPCQMDDSIKTTTGIPNFPAYVSGHSTFSAAAATYLSYVIPAKAITFKAMANEASQSRLYGAIHYRSDCEQGFLLGQRVGQIAITRASGDGAN